MSSTKITGKCVSCKKREVLNETQLMCSKCGSPMVVVKVEGKVDA